MLKLKFILRCIPFILGMFLGFNTLYAQTSGLKVSLNLKDVSIQEVLAAIEKKTDHVFFYNNADFDSQKKVTVNAVDKPVERIIAEILPGFDCKIENKKIILVAGAEKPQQSQGSKVLSGTILDSNGEPLIGASALVNFNDHPYGAVTDLDGKFEIVFPEPLSGKEEIRFSYIGFVDEVRIVGKQAVFDIVLKDDNELLAESVVVGYGVQKKVNLTGAVSAISSEELKDRPVANVGQALQGVVPNLNITTSGRPGEGSTFNIRGNGSTNGGTPLILVDGVETYLDRINSNDIESISVLMDASSAAIYGARGAFGVILVTTKSGKADTAPKVTADVRFSLSDNTVSTDFETRGYYSAYIANLFMSTKNGQPYTNYTSYDYQRLWERRNDKVENPERPWVLTEMRNGKLSYLYLANFDWYNYMFDETRPTQDYNVNVSGGSKNVSYMVSGRYYRQGGIFRIAPDDYDSFNVRAKMDIKICPWLKLTSNTKFFRGKYYYHGNSHRKPTLHALASFVPVNPDGTAVDYTSLTNDAAHDIMDGYSAMLYKGKQWGKQRTIEVTSSWALNADITKHLKFTADFSYKFGYLRKEYRDATVEYSTYPGEILTNSSYVDLYSDTVYEQNNYVANAFFSYDNTWKDAHHFTATAGINYEARHYKDLNVKRQDLLSEELTDFNLATGALKSLTGGVDEYALAGAFYRFTYDYKSRYLIEFNGRYDGSSRFPAGNRWGFFPSVSAAYRISEEPFMQGIKDVLNNAKLRVSYGSLGNQNIGFYTYYQTISTAGNMNYSFDGETKALHAVVGNPVTSGTWETVVTSNVGIDLGFLRDKLTFTANAYIRDTKGILAVGKPLPSIYGAKEPTVNANDIRTKGYELQIQWRDSFKLFGKSFDYSVGGNFADYVAHYTKADNPTGKYSEPYVGKKLGEIWGYRIGGLFKTDEEAAAYAARVNMKKVANDYYTSLGEYGAGVRAGDLMYLDLNGDRKIDDGTQSLTDYGDREIIGNTQPRYMFGFNFGFNYVGIDFQIFFQGIGQQHCYPSPDNIRFWGPYSRPYASFVGKDFMSNVWSETNPDAYFPRARGYAALSADHSLHYKNDRYLQDLAYIRLKNLTLGYTLPERLTSKIGIGKLRVYFSGENLWFASKLKSKYIDPEVLAKDPEGNEYSFAKTFSFGLTIDFLTRKDI